MTSQSAHRGATRRWNGRFELRRLLLDKQEEGLATQGERECLRQVAIERRRNRTAHRKAKELHRAVMESKPVNLIGPTT